MALIQAQTRRFWYLTFNRFGELDKVAPAHARIAEAIAANDEEAARAAFDALIDYVEEYTRRTVTALFFVPLMYWFFDTTVGKREKL